MLEITPDNAATYLRDANRADGDERIDISELSGGVSNGVLLVTLPRRDERFVLKQARPRLRVKDEWLCPVERIWREVDVLETCGKLLQAQSAELGARNSGPFECCLPQLLWEDRANYLYAMSAAPPEHKTWKELLLAGEVQAAAGLAATCGQLLGQLHAASWGDAEIAGRLDDRTYFDQLRLDPYYRHVACAHPDLSPQIKGLLDSVWRRRRCLVHGDFSPKNLLVWPGHVMLIDFEVGHYGDPAFDLGFFLTHLVLKSIWAGPRRTAYLRLATQFWTTYRQQLLPTISNSELADLELRTLGNLAGCMLARVDGKSPVDYLSAAQREAVRRLARNWLFEPPQKLDPAISFLSTQG
jgi:5-methylthioribose kinase